MNNRVNATIAIVPHGFTAQALAPYSQKLESIYSKQFSSITNIKVNKYNDGYIVVYTDEEFKKLNQRVFIDNFIALFMKNIPNTVIDVVIEYMYFEKVFMDLDKEVFDPNTAKHIMIMDKIITDCIKNKFISYHRTSIFSVMVEDYQDWIYDNDEDGSDDDTIDEGDELEENDYTSMYGVLGIPMSANDIDGNYEYEDEDGDDDLTEMERILGVDYNNKKSKKSRNKDKSYGRSKVLKNANNPKKSIHRHGIIIADDKRDIKSDIKIIQGFLKDFIPGNQSWKKEFRKDLLDRWVSMYCVSRKQLKKLEKKHRNQSRQKQSNINRSRALEFTKKVFNMPLDNWDNPNK